MCATTNLSNQKVSKQNEYCQFSKSFSKVLSENFLSNNRFHRKYWTLRAFEIERTTNTENLLLHLNQISPNKEEETDNSYNKWEGPKQSEMIYLDVSFFSFVWKLFKLQFK